MSLSLVAGLGNPGREYEGTRHNAGWFVLDAFARRHGLAWQKAPRFDAAIARWDAPGGGTRWLVKPLSFMNDSGRPLQAFARFHQVQPAGIAVVYDDVGIELGRMKVSPSGSAGGHNGVASLLEHLGDGFVRYRIGVGPRMPPEMDLKDFVLGQFTPEQSIILDKHLEQHIKGIELLVESGVDRAMNQLNRRETNETEQP